MAEVSNIIRPEQILEIALRRRWFIIFPFCIAMIVGIYLAFTLPKLYEASTLILIQPQKVPTNFVQSIVSSDMDSRISTISQQIMSSSNLEKIIEQFNLFSDSDSEKMFFEDKINALRSRIKVEVTRARSSGADAFSISFAGKNPQNVMQIANTLASFFINENLKLREASAIGTSDFLEVELNSMRKRLEENETELKNYREEFMGALPEQLDTNLRILDRLQEQLSNKQEGLRDAKGRLDEFDSQISEMAKLQGSSSMSVEDIMNNADADSFVKLNQLVEQYAFLKTKYTEQHPDILRLKKMIAKLEIEISSDQGKPNADSEGGYQSITSKIISSRQQFVQKQRRVELLTEINTHKKDIETLQKQIAVYQKRVEDTPKREQELLSLQRDYANIKSTYDSLLARKLEAQLSVNMEKKQKGEQFRILDSARLPERPVSPDMNKLFLIVLAAGLGIGCALAYLPEYLDNSFRRPEDIESFLGLPVLATVPIVIQSKNILKQRIITIVSIISLLFSLTLFVGFSVLTFKGVEKTMAFISKFV